MVMPSVIGGSIAAAGSLLGGAASAEASKKNNEAMLDYQKNRYQYTKADMQKAGLNPMLMSKGMSPGSAPTLQQPNLSGVGSGLASAANVVTQGYQAKTARNAQEQQGELVDSQIEMQKLQGANSAADTLNKLKQSEQIDAQTHYLNEQARTQEAQRALMLKQGANYQANTARTQFETVPLRVQAEYASTPTGEESLRTTFDNKGGGVVGTYNAVSSYIDRLFGGNSAKTESSSVKPQVHPQSKMKPNRYQQEMINQYRR